MKHMPVVLANIMIAVVDVVVSVVERIKNGR
jgi:hypothetical protein